MGLIARIITGQINGDTIGPSKLCPAYWRIIHPDFESEMLGKAGMHARVPDGKSDTGQPLYRQEKMYDVRNVNVDQVREKIAKLDRLEFMGYPVKDFEIISEPLVEELENEEIEATEVTTYTAPAAKLSIEKKKTGAVKKKIKKDPSYQDIIKEIEG